MRRDGRTDRQTDRTKLMVAFCNSADTPKKLNVVCRQKSDVTCVVTVLRSHKEVPWIDPFHVPLSRLVINFAGDTRFGLIAMV